MASTHRWHEPPAALPSKQGAVTSDGSNLVLVLAVDASSARLWKGHAHPRFDDLTAKLFDGEPPQVKLGRSTGLLLDLGGCGSSAVFRLTNDDVALIEHYTRDWNPDIEAAFLERVGRPLARRAVPLGRIEVKSGVLALVHAGESGKEISRASPPSAGDAKPVRGGVLLGVPAGNYEVYGEILEAKGDWGKIESRVRIVRDVSIAKARARKARTARSAGSAPAGDRRLLPLPKAMGFVASLASSTDGRWIVAGEKSGPTLVAWRETGEIAWSKELVRRPRTPAYYQSVMVSVHGTRVAAAVDDQLFVFDCTTGERLARHAVGEQGKLIHFVRFAPDGKNVLVGQLTTAYVLDWRTGKQRAALEDCSATCDVAISPDGKRFALPGYKLHLCSASTFEVTRTISPKGRYPTACAFSPDGKTLAIAVNGRIVFHDRTGKPRAQLPAASTVQEIDVNQLTFSPGGERLASASADGYVRLWDTAKRKLGLELPGHDTTIPGTGARSLKGLVFSPDGLTLYVGGAQSGTQAVTAHPIPKAGH